MRTEKELSTFTPAELAAYEAAKDRAAAARIPPQVDLPNDEERDQLLALIAATWPLLQPPSQQQQAAHAHGFVTAIHMLHFWKPRPLNTGMSVAMLADHLAQMVQQWSDDRLWRTVTALNLYAAAIVSGIAYTPPHRRCDMNLGLALHEWGRPRALPWRDVLAQGALPQPQPSPTPVQHSPVFVRAY